MDTSNPIPLIKKVGRGRTLSKPLDYSEARTALKAMLSGDFTDSQLGAFLQALRIKELTLPELTGMADEMLENQPPAAPLGEPCLVFNMCMDTPRKNGVLSCLAAHLLPYWGVNVCFVYNTPVLAGNISSFSKSFLLGEQLKNLVPINSENKYSGSLSRYNCSELLNGWQSLEKVRGELGFRSMLHTLEKLVNPQRSGPMILGISHEHYAGRLAETLGHLGLEGARVILGNHGSPDLNLHKPTRYYSWQGEVVKGEVPAPSEMGLEVPASLYTSGEFATWETKMNGGDPGFWNAVKYHLGFLLWCVHQAESPQAGLEKVKKSLE